MISILNLRAKFNMSQTELGKLLNVSRFTVANWEKGLTEPSASKIQRLAVVFNTTPSEVLDAVLNSRKK